MKNWLDWKNAAVKQRGRESLAIEYMKCKCKTELKSEQPKAKNDKWTENDYTNSTEDEIKSWH